MPQRMISESQPGTPADPGEAAAGEPDPGGDELWRQLGWHPDPGQLQQLEQLQQLLRHWNSQRNLTRLVEGDDYWIGQVFDSLWPLSDLIAAGAGAEALELIDVGTGGGFPGLAVAIALPSARLTLVDSVGRKVEAVAAMAEALGLGPRVSVRCERIERTGQAPECRGRFDLAMARAVARAPVVAEYLVPLLKPSGRALLYRGHWGAEDQQALKQACSALNARVDAVLRRDLPAGRGVRHLLSITPLGPCPKAYPRAVGVPSKVPIS